MLLVLVTSRVLHILIIFSTAYWYSMLKSMATLTFTFKDLTGRSPTPTVKH